MNRLAANWRLTNQKWYIRSLITSRRETPKKNSIYMALTRYTTLISPCCAEGKLNQVFIQIFHTLHVLFFYLFHMMLGMVRQAAPYVLILLVV